MASDLDRLLAEDGHGSSALAERAERVLAQPPDRAQIGEIRLLLTELSGMVLELETRRRRFERDGLAERLEGLQAELAAIDAARDPLRQRRAELGG